MLQAKNFTDLYFKESKNKRVEIFNPDDTFAILYLTPKNLSLYINFEEIQIRQASVIFLCPGEVCFSEDPVAYFSLIGFKRGCLNNIERLILMFFNNYIDSHKDPTSIYTTKKSNDIKIKQALSDIKNKFAKVNDVDYQDVASAINDLVLECVYQKLYGGLRDIVKFNDFLNLHYSNEHSVSHYANLLELPPKELLLKFKRNKYNKPSIVIKQRVLLAGMKLLVQSRLDVKEIGHRIGFEDPAYFARFFKKNVGITAVEFRGKFDMNKKDF